LDLSQIIRITGTFANAIDPGKVYVTDGNKYGGLDYFSYDTDGNGNGTTFELLVDDGDDLVVPDATPTITLTKSAASIVCQGEDITYVLSITNNSTDVATDISIQEVFLSNNVTYQSHTASNGDYSDASKVWTVGDLAASGSAELMIVATASNTTVTNRAYVSAVNGVNYGETEGYADANLAATMKTETVTFIAPDSLIWTGTQSADWNDYNNWTNSTIDVHTEAGFVPQVCTNVLIPAGAPEYPLLTGDLTTNACNHIWFEHGGEVARTDLLTYSEAYVQWKLQANRWYMLSAPLKNMYAGDIYVSDPNPITDGYKIEPMLFNVLNPETQTKTTEYKWTGSFNKPDIEFRRGEGVAIWVDQIGTDYGDHADVTFQFPKSDMIYHYYNLDGTVNEKTPEIIAVDGRDYKNRFIYEGNINSGLVELTPSPVTAIGQPVLVGNPFMAHIPFADFYAQNSTLIDNEYRLAWDINTADDGKVNTFYIYKNVSGSYVSTNPDPEDDNIRSNYIPPMQSFIVTSIGSSTPALKADITKTITRPGENLRSSTTSIPTMLEITAGRNGQNMSKNLLIYMDNASQAYVPAEDSYTLFSQNSLTPVIVYTRSSDGYALDINTIGSFDRSIPLCVRTSQKGDIHLKFAGMERFDNTKIFLHDTKTGVVTDLSENDEYVFNKNEDDLYVENRLFLTFGAITGIQSVKTAAVSVQNLQDQRIRIVSNNGSPLGKIQIMDVQGRVLETKEVQTSSYVFHAKVTGVYLIRITNSEKSEVKKAVIN
jgi:uncharacterized repeat protein (TIGR01451 family)